MEESILHNSIHSSGEAVKEPEATQFDYCACGRRKFAADYVCGECWKTTNYTRPSKAKKDDAKRVTVLSCPGGEFVPGATFLAHEFNLIPRINAATTLDLGHWTPGMVIEDWRGRRFQVVGEAEEAQRLEEAG